MNEPGTPADRKTIKISADTALFTGEIQGLVVTFHENERPLCGLAGLLDWRLQGLISFHLRNSSIVGKAGECVYFPVSRNQRTYHLLLAGAGSSEAPGQRDEIPSETLHAISRNLASLRLKNIGISRSDFGNVGEDFFARNFKGAPLWIVN